ALKRLQIGIGTKPAVLYSILSIFSIAQNRECRAIKLGGTHSVQLVPCSSIVSNGSLNDPQVDASGMSNIAASNAFRDRLLTIGLVCSVFPSTLTVMRPVEGRRMEAQ